MNSVGIPRLPVRSFSVASGLLLWLASCDSSRIYESNQEFKDRAWKSAELVTFEFSIPDTTATYSVYYNLRNTIDYPFARIFVMYHLADSSGRELSGKLLNNDLFDHKTGRPFGESGLGDIYDHRFPVLSHFRFGPGKHSVTLSQFMRQDTLKGVLAVGIRVEKDEQP